MSQDRLVTRSELRRYWSQSTLRRWIKTGKLPEPDVKVTRQGWQWKLSTLHQAGIKL